MKRLSPVVSPVISILFLYSSTVSFVQAAAHNPKMTKSPHEDIYITNKGAQEYKALFDDNTQTRYAPKEPVLIERQFEKEIRLKDIGFYDNSDYQVSISYRQNGLWQSPKEWIQIPLKSNSDGWRKYVLSAKVTTDKIRIKLLPQSDSPKGIAEINIPGADKLGYNDTLLIDQGKHDHSNRVYTTRKINDKATQDSFEFLTAYTPNEIQKAVLEYEVSGVSGGASVVRSVNDELAQGGLIIQPTPANDHKRQKVTEEINPNWLQSGYNKIKFFSLGGEIPQGYKIENVRVSITTLSTHREKQPRIVAYAPQKSLSYKDYAYLRGFIDASSQSIDKITIDGVETTHTLGSFEALVRLKGAKSVKVAAYMQDGTILTQKVALDTTLSSFQSKSVVLGSSGVEFLKKSKSNYSSIVLAQANKQSEISLQDAKLQIKKDALKGDRSIKVVALTQRELPPLNNGMVNVTKVEGEGYRFLPHGIKFDTQNNLSIAYDKSKLPKGTDEKDIKTYFFDEETGRWMPLAKIASAEGVVVSQTDHFTDMINAVIQTPDAPQAKAYQTTQIKDLKVANPGDKINLVEPPKPTAMGDAQLSYPIEIPQGRHGMAPSVGLNYSSGASNSWTGLGWNLSMPSVGIDTRWGVPRYDDKYESETYTIGGQQLTPMAHRDKPVARSADKTFYPRVEGSFSKIVRHGNSPKNYWWEITAKDGTVSYYGGTAGGALDTEAILTDAKGNIAHWALTQSIDVYGNTVTYEYNKVQDAGVGDGKGGVPGYNLYIKNINYTGFEGSSGAYDVTFITDTDLKEARRGDVSIDARLGFKQVTASLLRKIEVKFQGNRFRAYELVYSKGAFNKTLLKEVRQYDDSDGKPFNTHTFDYFDEVRDAQGNYVAFKGAKSWLVEGGEVQTPSTTPIPATPTLPTPTSLTTTPTITPPASTDGSGNGINNGGTDSTVKHNIKGLFNALEHVNEHARLSVDLEGILTHGDSLYHSTNANTGFVREQFNIKGNVEPALAPVMKNGIVDLIYAIDENPYDYVTVWKAPFDGTVSISAPARLIKTDEDPKADGVRLSIQLGNDELWSAVIEPNDNTQKAPHDLKKISVKEGDTILFRVQALSNGTGDILSWSPEVTYDKEAQSTKDANGLPLYKYNSLDDFIASAVPVELPIAGEVEISSTFIKPPLSDDVTLTLMLFDASGKVSKIWEKGYNALDTIDESASLATVKVADGDTLFALVSTQSNVDFKAIKWEPVVRYKSIKKSFVDRIIVGDIDPKIYSESIRPHYAVYQLQKSSTGWSENKENNITVTPQVPESFTGKGILHFTLKSDGKRLVKKSIAVDNGVLSEIDTSDLNIKKNQRVYFEYSYSGDFQDIDPSEWLPLVIAGLKKVNIQKSGLYDFPPSNKENFYRGWAEKYYDSSKNDPYEPLISENLQSNPTDFTVSSSGQTTDGNTVNTTQATADAVTVQKVSTTVTTAGTTVSTTTQTTTTPSQSVTVDTTSGYPNGATALSGMKSDVTTIHAALTIGILDGQLYDKSQTAGGEIGSSDSTSEGTLAMVDIDGDSLPDQVLIIDGVMGYKKNLTKNGIENFSSFKAISGVNSFHHSTSDSTNSGYEAHWSGIFAGTNESESTSLTNVYFADVNGDGLIDIVSNAQVYYNRLDDFGTPKFDMNSTQTPNPVDESGNVVASGWIMPQTPAQLDELNKKYPLHDVVRVWQAPHSGIVSITAPLHLIQDTSGKSAEYTLADGVRVAIQHKGNELWSTTIDAGDYTTKTPNGISAVTVNKGDRIYFRVQSIDDGMYDSVAWSPTIAYSGEPNSVDANGLSKISSNAADGFIVTGYDFAMPLTGSVEITGEFSKPATSDEVITRLVKVDAQGNRIVVWESTASQSAIDKNISISRSVTEGENYRFEIYSDTNVDWAKISWKPTVTYKQATGNINVLDENGDPQLILKPASILMPYSKVYKETPQYTASTSGILEATPQLDDLGDGSGTVTFSLKKGLKLLAKETLEYKNGTLITPVKTLKATVSQGEAVYIEYHVSDSDLAALIADNAVIDVTQGGTTQVAAGVYGYQDNTLFGPMYRDWGEFVYNGNEERATQPIDESKLTLDGYTSSGVNPESITNASNKNALNNAFATKGYDPTQSIFVIMIPRSDLGAWQGATIYTNLNADTMSSSRFGKASIKGSDPFAFLSTLSKTRAIPQVSKSTGDSTTLGGSAYGVGASTSDTQQKNKTLTEFIDMNGDRYPDIVGIDQIQYTNMLGALESAVTPNTLGLPNYSESDTTANTLGGTYGFGKGESTPNTNIKTASSHDPNAGISGNTGTTNDTSDYSLHDINGDGLPDRLYKDGTASLNLGYSFAAIENWQYGWLRQTESTSEGYGLGINIGHYSIGAGIAKSTSLNNLTHTLIDLNSDGLPDEVYIDGNIIRARLNTGNGFGQSIIWDGASDIYKGSGENHDKSATLTFCIPIPMPPPIPSIKICTNPGGSEGKGTGNEKAILNDIDGDGYLDFLTSTSTSNLSVANSTIGKTNLLKAVHRPLGATITLDYDKSGNTYRNPHHKWVLSTVEVHDGHAGDGVDTMKQKFEYAEGYYDRYEREFYGFAWVTVSDIDTTNSSVYRKNTTHYINTNYYEKGIADYTKVTDGSGKLYVETFNAYSTIDINTNKILSEDEKKEDSHITFSQLVQTLNRFYEGTGSVGQMSALEYSYDAYGNIIEQVDLGDPADINDDWTATLTYAYNTAKHILSVPQSIRIYDENGELLRDREATIDDNGAATQVRVNTGSTTLTSDMSYDGYGNLASITYPPNHKGERYRLDYTVDPVVHSYTTAIMDSFGYSTSAVYDYKFGAMLSQTDINDQPITYTLDAKGRIESITGPLEANSGTATITHSYYPDASTPYAITSHYDEGRSDTIDTVTFIDGLMRVIQTKKDAAIDDDKDGVAIDMMSVSGNIKYDSFGRTVASYYPVSEPLGSKGAFNWSVDPIAPTQTAYDILDRKIKTTLPDNATLTNSYRFKADREGVTRFHTLSTDANGNKSESFKDARERITSILRHNPKLSQPDIWTSYSYNAVNELLEVKDDKDNLTQAVYDKAGRRTHLYNPDSGWIESIYDDASNVVEKITPNLRAENKSIRYSYEYNRLIAINYPTNSNNDVTYTYGDDPSQYNLGRIVSISDGSGIKNLEYGKLGEVTKETKTLYTYTGTEPKTYTTRYRYDTWNRLRELIYPDGEVLTHTYNSGGELENLSGKKGTYTYDYLKTLTYDKFAQRVFVKYANDTTSTYSYEEKRRRLSQLVATDVNRTFMDNHYGYDKMQNVVLLSNRASVPVGSDLFGGESTQTFTYDNLYQLTGAEGSWTARQGHEYRYKLSMGYDTIGNIKTKNQLHDKLPYDGNKWIEQKGTTYDYAYSHNAMQPHAPTKIGNRTFTYDANGNQLGWEDTQNNNTRVMEWDEENRISTITDNGHTSYYVYDASGERTLKRTSQGETFYVNPYFVIREGQVASKHFYIGSQRITTKLVKQESQTVWGNGDINESDIIYEHQQYFYHPDHLGSSSFVTDAEGQVYEHMEYFPFGETFAHEHSNTQRTPYLFTGKELDEESGLYYYGARYYDPRTSVWQSPDPILGEYMSGKTNGGVFTPINLGLYTYTANNPVNLVDPDGERFENARTPKTQYTLEQIMKGTEESASSSSKFNFKNILTRVGTAITLALSLSGDTREEGLEDVMADIADASISSPLSDDQLDKTMSTMKSEFDKLNKRKDGPMGVQYALKASVNGDYTDYHSSTGKTYLRRGSLWKYGETTMKPAQSRYTNKEYAGSQSGSPNHMEIQFRGTQKACKQVEKAKIYLHMIKYGEKPPGNKLTR